MTTISAKVSGNDRVVSVEYDFGANLAEATAKFGEEIVFDKLISALTIDIQSLIRRGISGHTSKEGVLTGVLDDNEIQQKVSEWKPGISTRTKKDPTTSVLDMLSKMSPEDRAALLAQFQS